jgi:putative RNA 2'-phosphotransferase
MHNDVTRLSKFLSLILRHKPETVGLTLDEQGWVDVDELLIAMNSSGTTIDRALLHHIVDTNDKKRFMFSDDGSRIRASQGHSLSIDLALAPVQPPDVLYHGTASRFLASIREQGLLPGSRQHVHLSRDRDTAYSVGSRHGKPVILIIDAEKMYTDSYPFYCSDNGVWLTASVPVQYISFET